MTEISCQYALAIYRSALEMWLEQLNTARQTLAAHPETKLVLDSQSHFAARQHALDAILPESISQGVRNFLYVLLTDQRMEILGEITSEFERLVRRGPESRVAYVTSAAPLTEEEKAQLREVTARRFGGTLDLDFRIDPQILGGLIIKVGDEVIDGSLASKLASMRTQLTAPA
jgi:F-type H+-transporting ATPase subunit delta